MQILANALPGFRELRAPLVAGYSWLLFAWLVVDRSGGIDVNDPTVSALKALSETAGAIPTALALSVTAYLLGSVSQSVSTVLRDFVSRRRGRSRFVTASELAEQTQRELEPTFAELHNRTGGDRQLESLVESAREIEREILRDFEGPSILLLGKEEKLFAEVDRLRAEGELRLAAVVPLVALMFLLALPDRPVWFAAIPALVVLFAQGIQKAEQASELVASAVTRGRVEAPAVERLKRSVRAMDEATRPRPPRS